MNVVRNYAIAIATPNDWLTNFASCTRDFSRTFEQVALNIIVCFSSRCLLLGSLSNHDDDGNKNPTNLHI